MDIIFLVPAFTNPKGFQSQGVFSNHYPDENLGVAYLLAALHKADIEADVYDFNFEQKTEEEIIKLALEKCPKIIGITTHQYSFLHAKNLTKIIRKMNFTGKIIMGGQFPSLASKFVFENCLEVDHILLGECDNTIVEYVKCVINGADFNSIDGFLSRTSNSFNLHGFPKIKQLDTLPIPCRYGKKYNAKSVVPSVSSSRGCSYGRCTFCSTAAYYKNIYRTNMWRYRSSESVCDELKHLYDEQKCEYFVFADETVFNTCETQNRIPDALKKLEAEGIRMNFMLDCRAADIEPKLFLELKKYGLVRVFVGFETNDPKYLKMIMKGTTTHNNEFAVKVLKQLEIQIVPGFIPFYPEATLESIKEDFRFMVETIGYNKVHKYVKRLVPEVSTPFFEKLLKEGNLYGNFPLYEYKFYDIRVQKLYDDLKTLIFEENITDAIKLYNFVMNAK
jgi:anaerobic magnesium-protoporphyrin IX monomethyl ester cyclase